jgi:anti-sigma factor RsiW
MQCQTFERYIIDYVDGTLRPQDAADVDAHLQQCARCRSALADARAMSESLRALPQEPCPDYVIESVLEDVERRVDHDSWVERLSQWCGSGRIWKTGFAMATALLLVVAAGLYQGGIRWPARPETYSAADVEQARREIELTLAYIHHYTQQAGEIVEYQLASTQEVVTEPVHTILVEQLQSTQTAVRQPVQTFMNDAVVPLDAKKSFDAMASFLGEIL